MSEALPQLKEKMSLRELTDLATNLFMQIAESGGEITPEIESLMQNLDLRVGSKIDGYKFLMNKMESEAAFWKREAEVRANIAKACAAFNARMTEAIKEAMVKLDVKEIQGETFRAVLTATKGRLVLDEEKLPSEFKDQVVSMVPNKEKIKAELEALGTVPGASLEGGLGLRIYPVKAGGK